MLAFKHTHLPTHKHTHITNIHTCLRAQKHTCDQCACILPCPTSTTSSCYSYFHLVGLCICVYMHMHMYIHVCAHAYPPTHERAYMIHTHYTKICMHTYNTCTNTYLDTSIHTRVRLCLCVCVRTRLCVRDGEGDAVDLGQRKIRPAGARQHGAEAAPDTAGKECVWRITCSDGVLWGQSHASADSRGPQHEHTHVHINT